MYRSNLQPIKRPQEIIKMENTATEYSFLCPHCLNVYHAEVGYSIFYDEYIDRSKEGLVMRPSYFCKKCGDYAFQVDERIIESVRRLLQAGIETISSCSGHPEKFRDCAFSYESGLLGLSHDTDECTYGACISMIHPSDFRNQREIFHKVFQELAAKYDNSPTAIFLKLDDNSPLHFIICPVMDVKDFRKAGLTRRTMMIDKANQHMDEVTREFVSKYLKELKRSKNKGDEK